MKTIATGEHCIEKQQQVDTRGVARYLSISGIYTRSQAQTFPRKVSLIPYAIVALAVQTFEVMGIWVIVGNCPLTPGCTTRAEPGWT